MLKIRDFQQFGIPYTFFKHDSGDTVTNPKRTFTVSKKIDDLHCPCEICQNTERQIETDNSPHIDMVVLCYFINIDD